MASKKKTMAEKGVLAWHFLTSDMKLGYSDGRLAEVGKTLSIGSRSSVDPCYSGMHASKQIMQAASFTKGPVLCRVEISGEIKDQGGNKLAGRNRTVLWAKKIDYATAKALAKACGGAAPTSSDDSSIAYAIDSCDDAKAEKWLSQWAATHGCVDGKYQHGVVVVGMPLSKPEPTKKVIKSVLLPRVVQSVADIKKSLAGYELDDISDVNAFGDPGTLGEFLSELASNGDILEVDNFTSSGDPGYLLGVRK